jgi:2-keto-4-pentenoate hydratase/2-oxohepta-3-ene-1,7-dioic acid hydratase in catechol pathway
MRLATLRKDARARFGAVVGEGFIDLSERMQGKCSDLRDLLARGLLPEAGRLCRGARPDFALNDATFLPLIPNPETRIFALGWAYKDHQLEGGIQELEFPQMFSKHPQSLVGHAQPIIKPRISERFDYEGEVAIVIGKAGRHIAPERAMEHIAGYSILMDGSVRDWQKHSITAGKNFDGSSAYGPWLATRDEVPDPKQMTLCTRLNGREMQRSSFGLMAWDLGFLLNYISTFTRLEPGDAISTGTPGGVGHRRNPQVFMKAGDELEIEVSGVGVLRNRVVEES